MPPRWPLDEPSSIGWHWKTLDLPGESLDKVFAINVNLFWVDDPAPQLELLRRVLAPGGAIYLCYEPPSPAQTARLTDRIIAVLTAACFEPDIVTDQTSTGAALLCVTARLRTGSPETIR